MNEILMICTGNICRSPMAEGLLRHLLPPQAQAQITVRSAGTHGLHGHQAEPNAIAAMAQWGIAYATGPNYNMEWRHYDPVGKAESLSLVLGVASLSF